MKRFFLRGLAALLPLVLTLWVFHFVLSLLYSSIGVPLGHAVQWLVVKVGLFTPPPTVPGQEYSPPWFFPASGFVIGLAATIILGFFVATFLGGWILKWLEWILQRLPVIRVIYPYAKQLSDFLFPGEGQKAMNFKTPVAIPFPTHGMYSVGFITSEGLKHLDDVTQKHLACVFVPTAPTPFTGFIVYVPREEIIPLPISVDDAMRLFISAGVIAPVHQVPRHGGAGWVAAPHAAGEEPSP